MTAQVEVWLSLHNQDFLIGIAYFLLRRGIVSTTFSYADDWLENPEAFPIDPFMPLSRSSYHCEGLPGAFRDSVPDRWGRHLIIRREFLHAAAENRPSRMLDEVDFLLGVHDLTRQGALRFKLPASDIFLSEQNEVPPLIEMPRLLHASNQINTDEEGAAAIKELLDAGSASVGGARPKATVADGNRLLLAKFSHPSDEWDVIAWEKATLDLAALAGISVPQSQFVRLGKGTGLTLERFDRQNSQRNGERIAYMSGMTLLGAQDGEIHDYAELAEALAPIVANTSHTLHDLFRRIVFSIAVHNTDDHLRNIGFLRKNNAWELAPLFDVNPNPIADKLRVTSIMGEVGSEEANALASCIDTFGLSKKNAGLIVRQVFVAMREWQKVARKAGIKERDMCSFAPVFAHKNKLLRDAFLLDT